MGLKSQLKKLQKLCIVPAFGPQLDLDVCLLASHVLRAAFRLHQEAISSRMEHVSCTLSVSRSLDKQEASGISVSTVTLFLQDM